MFNEKDPDKNLNIENSLVVIDKQGNPIEYGQVLLSINSINTGMDINVSQITDIETLRATEPVTPGDIAIVLEYNHGSRLGGGLFIYNPDEQGNDDHGLVIRTKSGKAWKRYVTDYNSLTILDFGAKGGKDHDCAEAVRRMHDWSQSDPRFQNVGIRFPAGIFNLSKLHIADKAVSWLKISGPVTDFGYFAGTTLYSDKKNNEFIFDVRAKRVEISGIIFDGESTPVSEGRNNTKGFYRNATTEGQYLRVSCVSFKNVGGHCLDVVDTLDCKIDQWYASHCQGIIINGSWSNGDHGWNHLTAIELSNFNVQACEPAPVLNLRRASQSLIRNGWIEHCYDPGDISDGQWIIEALSIESCTIPLRCHGTRAITMQPNLQSGGNMDFSPIEESYLTSHDYETGDILMANHGININGSLSTLYQTAQVHATNTSDKEKWFKLGLIDMPGLGAQVHIKVLGSGGYNTIRETQTEWSTRTGEGCANVYLQRLASGGSIEHDIGVTWASEGSSPVTAVWIDRLGNGRAEVYVKLSVYSVQNILLITTNVADQFQQGIHFRFVKTLDPDNANSYFPCSDAESAALDLKKDLAFHQHWVGNNKVGFGFNHNNELLLAGTFEKNENITTENDYLRIMVNGERYGLQLYKIQPDKR